MRWHSRQRLSVLCTPLMARTVQNDAFLDALCNNHYSRRGRGVGGVELTMQITGLSNGALYGRWACGWVFRSRSSAAAVAAKNTHDETPAAATRGVQPLLWASSH